MATVSTIHKPTYKPPVKANKAPVVPEKRSKPAQSYAKKSTPEQMYRHKTQA